ncbi:MAG: PAS domain S-box protein [Chloroflexi bacterium]|nr:PAS domain S-box protein [Chloroflexota bacterium]
MISQINLYISSIFLTFLLTGFLAWYAWGHRRVPGTRAYAALAFAECLLALSELLSVFSASMNGALFWFRVRYILGALIAVFWLVFALEYNGHREWISKRLLVGLFFIPFVTQILFWSNSQHGLWMKQEATFYQTGRLWIADISSRIPEIGYMTHLFYNLFLTLAGIALMLLTAWRMRHVLAGQALLLAGAGLTALFFVLNSLFGLLPKMEFNTFTPGIGLSVLLIALAVFRFDFLKHAPAQENPLGVTRLDTQEKYSLAGFILTFILFTSGLAAVSYITYHNYEKQFRAQVEGELSAIAELKMSGIVNWRAERTGDAEVMHKNPVFAELVRKSLENPDDVQAETQLQTWLDTIRNSYGYDRVFLLDTQGIELVSSPTTLEPVADHLKQQIATTLKTGQVTFLDFHRDSPNGSIHLALLVPIYLEHDLNRPLGLLVLRIDPTTYLYPYISQWPTLSQTAETLLVRHDGDGILYLNELKFQQDAALNLRIPLEESQVLAVQVVQGTSGIVQGVDYRGEEVIGYVDAIPDSPWYLVARMDTAEVYAPLRARLWQTIFFFGALVLAAGSGLMLSWRQQRVRTYRRQVEAVEALRASEEKFRLAFETSPDLLAITRFADGSFVSVNQSYEQILGYAEADLLGKTSLEVGIWDSLEDRRKFIAALQSKGKVENYEARFRAKNGDIHDSLVSSTVIQLNGEQHILSFTRDITERKRTEEALRESEDKFKHVFDYSVTGNSLTLPSGEINVNRAFCEMLGYSQEELKGGKWQEISHPDDMELTEKVINSLLTGEKESARLIKRYIHKNGSVIWADVGTALRRDKDGKPLYFMTTVNDITERKQAEESLRESEERFSKAFHSSPVPQAIIAQGTSKVMEINDANCRLFGYSREELVDATTSKLNLWENPADRQSAVEELQKTGRLLPREANVRVRSGMMRTLIAAIEPISWKGIPCFIVSMIDITERKQADMALRENEERWRRAIADSPIPIMIHDEDDRVLQLSAGWTKFSGYDIDDIPTLADWTERAYGERTGFKKDYIDQLFSINQTVQNGEWIVTAKDGSKRIWDFQTTPLGKGSQGRRVLHSMAIDITERKRVEEALRESEAFVKTVLDNLPVGIAVNSVDPAVTFSYMNDNFTKFYRTTRENLVNPDAFWSAVYEESDFREEMKKNILNDLASGNPERMVWVDVPIMRKGEPTTFITARNIPVPDKPWMISTVWDVTERKQAEEALRESEERLRLSLRAANQGTYDLNIQTGAAIVSEEYVLMLGYDPETFVETNAAWIERLHPDDKDTTAKAYMDYTNGVTSEYRVEFRQKTKDGGWKWILSLGKIVEFDAGGKPLRMLGTHTDITERKQAEEALQNYNVRLEAEVEERTRELREAQEQLVRQERLATLGQLAGGVGHELRNPLGVISNAVYYLKLIQPDASDKVREYLNIIEKEIHASDKIVTDLLDFTRIKSLDRRPVSVSELVGQTLERYPVPPSIEKLVELPTDLPKIYADPQHVIQVLVNLVSNACQAIVAEKSTTGMLNAGKLTITAAAENDMIRIDVQDTGTGISPENMKRLFEPLFTTKSKGIGLGLAVSRKLIEANSGRIEVQSEVGIGSTFTVYLPVKQ